MSEKVYRLCAKYKDDWDSAVAKTYLTETDARYAAKPYLDSGYTVKIFVFEKDELAEFKPRK